MYIRSHYMILLHQTPQMKTVNIPFWFSYPCASLYNISHPLSFLFVGTKQPYIPLSNFKYKHIQAHIHWQEFFRFSNITKIHELKIFRTRRDTFAFIKQFASIGRGTHILNGDLLHKLKILLEYMYRN